MNLFFRMLFSSLFMTSQVEAAPLLGLYAGEPSSGPAAVNARETWLGADVDIMLNFTGLATWESKQRANWQFGPIRTWLNEKPGRNVVMTMVLLPANVPSMTLEGCAKGTYNKYWVQFADRLMDYQLQGVIIRPGHEAFGSWYRWSALGREATYAKCFRQVVTSMRNAHPQGNWKYDYNPTTNATIAQIEAAYPGDAYVDYITTDFYDVARISDTYPYPANCDAACRLTRQKRNWTQAVKLLNRIRDVAKAHGKKMGISEWGVWDEATSASDHKGGGDNPYYIEQMYKYSHDQENNFGYQIYFDVKAGDGNHKLYSTEASPTSFPLSAAAYKKLFGASQIKMNNYSASAATVRQGESLMLTADLEASGVDEAVATAYLMGSDNKPIASKVLIVDFKDAVKTVKWNLAIPETATPSSKYSVLIRISDKKSGDLKVSIKMTSSLNVIAVKTTVKTISASISNSTPKLSESLKFSGSVQANAATDAIILYVIKDAQNKIVGTASLKISLVASKVFNYTISYKVPSNLPKGAYQVSLDLRGSDWSNIFERTANRFSFVIK